MVHHDQFYDGLLTAGFVDVGSRGSICFPDFTSVSLTAAARAIANHILLNRCRAKKQIDALPKRVGLLGTGAKTMSHQVAALLVQATFKI